MWKFVSGIEDWYWKASAFHSSPKLPSISIKYGKGRGGQWGPASFRLFRGWRGQEGADPFWSVYADAIDTKIPAKYLNGIPCNGCIMRTVSSPSIDTTFPSVHFILFIFEVFC